MSYKAKRQVRQLRIVSSSSAEKDYDYNTSNFTSMEPGQ